MGQSTSESTLVDGQQVSTEPTRARQQASRTRLPHPNAILNLTFRAISIAATIGLLAMHIRLTTTFKKTYPVAFVAVSGHPLYLAQNIH